MAPHYKITYCLKDSKHKVYTQHFYNLSDFCFKYLRLIKSNVLILKVVNCNE